MLLRFDSGCKGNKKFLAFSLGKLELIYTIPKTFFTSIIIKINKIMIFGRLYPSIHQPKCKIIYQPQTNRHNILCMQSGCSQSRQNVVDLFKKDCLEVSLRNFLTLLAQVLLLSTENYNLSLICIISVLTEDI